MMVWGDPMKITDKEMLITTLISVTKGRIRSQTAGQSCRKNDGFIFVLSGEARYEFAEKSFSVAKGDLFYLPKDGCYTIAITGHPYTFIYTDFLFHRPEEEVLESDVYPTGVSLEHTFRKLLNLWNLGDFSDKLRCRGLLYEIYAAAVKAAALKELSTEHTHRLDQVMAYLQAHYTDPDMTVEQLAGLYGTSTVHFRRTFSRLYRTSPMKFITALRLSKARDLLLNTDLPVGEICTRCGYTSLYYFDRVFKQEFGTQPLQLRKTSL